MKRQLSCGLAAVLLLGLLTGCGGEPAAVFTPETAATTPAAPSVVADTIHETPGETSETGETGASAGSYATDYQQVAEALAAAWRLAETVAMIADGAVSGLDKVVMESSAAAAPTIGGTNVQVAGVDEADVVKTDGQYLYALYGNEIVIYRADGANSARVGRIPGVVSFGTTGAPGTLTPSQQQVTFEEMFLMDALLLVLGRANEPPTYELQAEGGSDVSVAGPRTVVLAYDVSDPSSPVLHHWCGQDGLYRDARLVDGRLYVLSDDSRYGSLWLEGLEEASGRPADWIPAVYDGEGSRLQAPEEIWLPAEGGSRGLAVISVFDAASGAVLQTGSVQGWTETVYLTDESLYLAWSWTEQQGTAVADGGEPEEVETVEGSTEARTQLLRYDLTDGLVLTAQQTLEGYLDSQFSLDETADTLRLVLTRETYRWRMTQTGNEDQRTQDNALLILDRQLQELGRVDHLGQDELVYAVRFEGDYAYFVTFRETDPLYCVDLRDPANPVVCSALKIPGFSDYLHPWGDGRLLGLGMDVDELGITHGLKLAMYDTSEPTALQELHTLTLSAYQSEALTNHKAVLALPERGLIGLPTPEGYALYRYDEAEGFAPVAQLETHWGANARGLCIDECFYVCSGSGLTVLSLTEPAVVCELTTATTEGQLA